MNVEQAWAVLDTVPDPEIPVLSLRDLGIVREVLAQGDTIEVVLTPTYSGCPATEVIADSVHAAFAAAGCSEVTVRHRLAPAWTTDWISEAGRSKLRDYGIAPPGAAQTISIRPRNIVCPRCASGDTERLSAFGSTACKALYRCRACREPFEHFKPL
ncbi:MAG: 1,2-phenylacetyl-CoA epoxidase subunit PaaD [Rubrivivax sp.]